MVLINFKITRINGSVNPDIQLRQDFNEGQIPVVGNVISIQKNLYDVVGKENDTTLIINRKNPNYPYIRKTSKVFRPFGRYKTISP